jgi:hypothetical protein
MCYYALQFVHLDCAKFWDLEINIFNIKYSSQKLLPFTYIININAFENPLLYTHVI